MGIDKSQPELVAKYSMDLPMRLAVIKLWLTNDLRSSDLKEKEKSGQLKVKYA